MGTGISKTCDLAAARIATRQNGNISRRQLLALGMDDRGIGHRVGHGRLFRVHAGVYAVGRPPVTPVERAAAAVLACGERALLSHAGALALWGLTRHWPDQFDVTLVTGDRRPQGITVHLPAGLTRADVRVQLGVPVTSLARTVLDCAAGTPVEHVPRLVNDALLSRFLSGQQLADALARFPRHPGARLVRSVIADGEAPTRSEFEDRFVGFCARWRLPRPQMNVIVAGHEVDALFAEQRLIVELDGWRFHRGQSAFHADRARDADTLAAGHATLRLTWKRMTDDEAGEAARLQHILRQRSQ